MSYLPLDLLRSGASEMGIELTDEMLGQMDAFAAFLAETNAKFNLTRITEPAEMVTGHFLDSLTCLRALDVKPNAKIIDVGTGAGFPGIPIKIACPDLRVTLLDSTFKKVKFLSEAVEKLELQDVECVHARAEDIGHDKGFRESFDVAYARALADMRILAEICLPLVRVGGHLVAQKSASIAEEAAKARPVIGQMGGRIQDNVEVHIPGTDITRTLVVIAKTKPTPPPYPRPYSTIARVKKRD